MKWLITEVSDHSHCQWSSRETPPDPGREVRHPVDEHDDEQLDAAFLALADPVRRRIISRLSRGPATVNELAEPFAITKQAVSKHIQVLEQAQLVTRTRDAQRRPVHLNPPRLEALTAWIGQYRLYREEQFRSLDAVLQSKAAARGSQAKDSSS